MNTEQEYLGFLKTHYLFNQSNNLAFDIFIEDLAVPKNSPQEYNSKLRLGNRVEKYVLHQLQANDFNVLANNFQVISNGQTLGEIDCILSKDATVIHLEIVCKFYLYDSTVGLTELDHWIGPNRKDSLIEKVLKLQTKQLPLLNNPITKTALKALNIEQIDNQQVFFKGQLFVPFLRKEITFSQINQNSVVGTYLSINNFEQLKEFNFYIPTKEEWIQAPNQNVSWIDFESTLEKITPLISSKKSPMCWIKYGNGKTDKMFITWW